MTDLRRLLDRAAPEAAPSLLGAMLVTDRADGRVAIRILEVEAYTEDDPASHSFRGPTTRNRSMFADPGTLYVYRSYGIHWCANVATGGADRGDAVLLRGGRISEGAEVARRRRGRSDHLADGPGKLCQALGISGEDDGVDLLAHGETRLLPAEPAVTAIRTTPRVGISKAVDRPWRFVVEDRAHRDATRAT